MAKAASLVGAEFCERLRVEAIDLEALSGFLDSLEHTERVEAIRSAGRREQKNLWRAAEGFASVGLVDLVPETCAAGETVRHFGKNTLPAFTHFEKRFARPEGGDAGKPAELHGFNFQKLAPITGPGYFTATASGTRPEVLIDYRRVPDAPPAGWPAVRGNEGGLSRLVYGFMVDTLRGVSEHVTIGSAAKNGKDMGSWFLLTRQA